MAFPGGRRSPEDRDLCSTAVRETLEEVGLRLGAPFGRLDETESGRGLPSGPLFISPFVFELEERVRTTTNEEVQEAVWVPLPELLDPGSAAGYNFERPGVSATFPAIRYKRFTIWGLTYRILESFFALLDRELPTP
jgi:8-oxo-dGTP pyrophosphatase MutT (NUDIX family)